MNLTTRYMGLSLSSPFVVGSSPMGHDLDLVKRLEDAGAAAIVMPSIFEEQITREEMGTFRDIEWPAESFAEAISYFPSPPSFKLGPDSYLDRIRRAKEAVGIPVIGSLNGSTSSGWLQYAGLIKEAGADALEMNVYFLATGPDDTCSEVEERTIEIVRGVKAATGIPLSVKLSPFFSSLPHLASRIAESGAAGLVLFNRFLQPDIDIDALEVEPRISLSDSSELLLRLRWLAILSGRIDADLACSGGVHSVDDAVKAVMAGASIVQMVSALLKNGPEHVQEVREGFSRWLDDHEYDSLEQMRGSMSHSRCPSPEAFERANYVRVLQGWRRSLDWSTF